MKNNYYKILLVDDESDILEFLGYNLRKEGYQVFEANNGIDAVNQTKIHTPHLILLDIMMPSLNGVEACREIRKLELKTNPIIVFLSARSEEYLQCAAISARADDYITKPIKPQILINRIKELFNDSFKKSQDNFLLMINDLQINKSSNVVTKGLNKFLLTKKQIEILFLLASSPGRIFSKEEIFNKIWGDGIICSQIFIEEYIRKINEKTGIKNIKPVNGNGFKFELKND